MKTKTINVTQHDIDNGIADSNKSCPVALAIRRAFKKGKPYALVGWYTIGIGTKRINTPSVVRNFIYDFDKKSEVEPFSFTLEY
jgi:hypothetical protein